MISDEIDWITLSSIIMGVNHSHKKDNFENLRSLLDKVTPSKNHLDFAKKELNIQEFKASKYEMIVFREIRWVTWFNLYISPSCEFYICEESWIRNLKSFKVRASVDRGQYNIRGLFQLGHDKITILLKSKSAVTKAILSYCDESHNIKPSNSGLMLYGKP